MSQCSRIPDPGVYNELGRVKSVFTFQIQLLRLEPDFPAGCIDYCLYHWNMQFLELGTQSF